jgi:hypothetical protein
MYRLAFQAPFPYVANHGALEAARQRRTIVDILTKFWFGHHLVAPVIEIDDMPDGGHDFVTRLVRGHEPDAAPRAKAFLRELDRRFLAAGLPTWQVTPYNPHSITNFIEQEDGTFRIIDLESSLVACLYPVSGLFRLASSGLLPSFDDIDVERLREYVGRNFVEMRAVLGDEYHRLTAAIDAYDIAASAWHESEPRLFNRTLKLLLRPFRRTGARSAQVAA